MESDRDKLIDIGLSYIPEDCGVTLGIKTARRDVMTAVPGSFGVQNTPMKEIPSDLTVGNPGYDAPSNIGIMIIG